MVVAWRWGDDGAGRGGGAGVILTGEPEQQWWRTKWAGDNTGRCGKRRGQEGR